STAIAVNTPSCNKPRPATRGFVIRNRVAINGWLGSHRHDKASGEGTARNSGEQSHTKQIVHAPGPRICGVRHVASEIPGANDGEGQLPARMRPQGCGPE